MRQGSLRLPVSCCLCRDDCFSITSNDIHGDYFLYEDTIIQPECMRVEVEVSFGRRVVRCLIGSPYDICESHSRFAILGFTGIVIIRWIHPQGTTIWHWRIADVSWCTTPKCINPGMLRSDWTCI